MENDSFILSTLQAMQRDVAEVKGKMATKDDLVATEGRLRSEMATKSDLDVVKKEVAELRGEQVSMFAFLQENAVTKRDLTEAKSEMMTHIDGLASHNQKFDQELLMIRNRQDRLEARVA